MYAGSGVNVEIYDSTFQSNTAGNVRNYFFYVHPSIFCQKNYLKMSLQFPARAMQLLKG
jgi:hypothetical protein